METENYREREGKMGGVGENKEPGGQWGRSRSHRLVNTGSSISPWG